MFSLIQNDYFCGESALLEESRAVRDREVSEDYSPVLMDVSGNKSPEREAYKVYPTSPILRALLVTHMFVSNVELGHESTNQHNEDWTKLAISTKICPSVPTYCHNWQEN